MYSTYKLNKQGDNVSLNILLSYFGTGPYSMSSSNCCFLTCIQISEEAGTVVWYSHLLKKFPQFVVIHTVKIFEIVNKTEIDIFLETKGAHIVLIYVMIQPKHAFTVKFLSKTTETKRNTSTIKYYFYKLPLQYLWSENNNCKKIIRFQMFWDMTTFLIE